MTLRRRHGERSAMLFLTVLPITPLVDISLLLVVFFLIAGAAADHRTLPVALPEAGTGAAAVANTLEVSIDRAGTVRSGGRDIALGDLATLAKGAGRATLHADASVAHGKVVAVVDALRKAGVEKIYYATLPAVVDW